MQPIARWLQAQCPLSPARCPQTDLCPFTLLSEWETLEVKGSGDVWSGVLDLILNLYLDFSLGAQLKSDYSANVTYSSILCLFMYKKVYT